jgi:hypothetical protein
MTAVAPDWQPSPQHLPFEIQSLCGLPGSAAALQPAFGYNAFYLGGWKQRVGDECHTRLESCRWTDESGNIRTDCLVTKQVNHIRHPESLIAFASSTYRPRGSYKHGDENESYAPGCAWIVPAKLGTAEMWNAGGSAHFESVRVGVVQESESSMFATELLQSDLPAAPKLGSDQLVVVQQHGVPLRRFTRQSSVMTVDGSVSQATPEELMDMTRWINDGWKWDFRHGDE